MKTDVLIREIKRENVDKVRSLLDEGDININHQDKKSGGRNILQLAIGSDNTEIFRQILAYSGLNFNGTSLTGDQTPLQTAITFGNVNFFEQLLNKPCDKNQTNSLGLTAVQTAVLENRPEFLAILKKHHASFNPKTVQGSLLNLSVSQGSTQCTQWLLKNQPDLNFDARDENGNTCLHLSTISNNPAVCQLLIQHAKRAFEKKPTGLQDFINAQNNDGDTALHIAQKGDHQTVLQIIQNSGVPLNLQLRNRKGDTVADIVTKRQQAKVDEAKAAEKLKEQKKQRQAEKALIKQREIQKAIEEEKRKKKQMKELEKQAQRQKEEHVEQEQKKTRWTILVGFVGLLIAAYLIMNYLIQRNKSKVMFLDN